MPSLTTLVDGTVPVAADFNGNFTALNNAIGASTSISSYTTGDTVYASAANTLNKLPIGSTGQVLTVSGGVPAWSSSTGLLFDQLTGLALSNSGSDLQVAVGACASDDGTIANRISMNLTSALVGKTGGTWVVGTNQNKLDAGTVANSTTYHVYVIERTDTAVVDILFSTSATAPTLPTNYTKQRRIGSFITDGAAAIIAFSQDGDDFLLSSPVLDVNASNPGTAAVTRTLTVPSGVKVQALLHVRVDPTTSGSDLFFVYLSSLDVTDLAPSETAAPLATLKNSAGGNVFKGTAQARVRTNTSAQIRSRCGTASGASDNLKIATLGWTDRRGRG